MKREIILKYVKVFCGYLIIVVSIIEIFNFIILSLTPVNILESLPLLISIFFDMSISRLTLSFLWIFLLLFSIFTLLIGVLIARFVSKEKIQDFIMSKYILLFGFFFLIFMIIKAELFFMISRSEIMVDLEVILVENLFYSEEFLPFYALLMWVFHLMSISYMSVLGMVVGGSSLTWILQIEEAQENSIS